MVLVILYYHMLQNKESNSHSLYSMTSVVALFAYLIKSNILTRKGVTKFYQRGCIVILTDLPNAINKMLDKISFHKHCNTYRTSISCNNSSSPSSNISVHKSNFQTSRELKYYNSTNLSSQSITHLDSSKSQII